MVLINNNKNVIMKEHYLKTVNPYFSASWEDMKTFECRLNDRDFKVGDNIYLMEFDKVTLEYSGRVILGVISYILVDYPDMVKNHVVFSYRRISVSNNVFFNLQNP